MKITLFIILIKKETEVIMPRLDKTGPEGKGTQSGRRMGRCNPDNNFSDEMMFGKGRNRGLGRKSGGCNKQGRGHRNGLGAARG